MLQKTETEMPPCHIQVTPQWAALEVLFNQTVPWLQTQVSVPWQPLAAVPLAPSSIWFFLLGQMKPEPALSLSGHTQQSGAWQ